MDCGENQSGRGHQTDMEQMTKPRCFKCEREISSAVSYEGQTENDTWAMPSGAVTFSGGGNFGSTIYDTLLDGLSVEIIVCDECLKAAKGTSRLREVQGYGYARNKKPENPT